MFIRVVVGTFLLLFIASLLYSSDAICKDPKNTKNWKRKSLVERAIQSDIVIYGEVFNSPCWKPGFVKPTAVPTTPLLTQAPSGVNSTNTTSNATFTSTPLPVNTNNTTTLNATTKSSIPTTVPPYNCSSEYYDAIIKVICVMKGGSVPLVVRLSGLGHGDGVCLDETQHDHHAYRMLKYLIFIGRKKNPTDGLPFRINPVNYQPALEEIDDESELEPIFEAIGRNAHLPTTIVNQKDHGVCKPHVSSAHACCTSLLMILLASISFLM